MAGFFAFAERVDMVMRKRGGGMVMTLACAFVTTEDKPFFPRGRHRVSGTMKGAWPLPASLSVFKNSTGGGGHNQTSIFFPWEGEVGTANLISWSLSQKGWRTDMFGTTVSSLPPKGKKGAIEHDTPPFPTLEEECDR